MPELIPRQQSRIEGFFPDAGNAVIELHRLLAIFLSSRRFAELCEDYPSESFNPIYKIQEVEEEEITRILLNLAITARVIDDQTESKSFKLFNSNCGTLQINFPNSNTKNLDLREACNKLIHAKKVRFDVDDINGQSYLNPTIYLYGNYDGKEWRVELNVIEFCKKYVEVVCTYLH